MTGLFNPDDWKDVFVLCFLGVCTVASAAVPLWAKLKKIDNQVSNSHEENLRDEITRGFKELRDDNRDLRDDISGLREELRTERRERIAGDERRCV